jgi:hypothetical protein
MTVGRFNYPFNLSRAKSYQGHRSPFWPPADRYEISFLELAQAAPDLGDGFRRGLADLHTAIELEWQRVKESGAPSRTRFTDPAPIARALREVGACLPGKADRQAVEMRASAIEQGYDVATLKTLADIEEDVAVVAGQIATWYGKQLGGLPTAFASRRDDARQGAVDDACDSFTDVRAYLAQLHADLRLGEVPAFAATELFFMAGEGNRHPKHIAYFLPEDEGVKHSPFKKTYYFGNTHRGLLDTQSAPLAQRHLDIGTDFRPAEARFEFIPTLGVFGHELGHCVHRPVTSYKALNAADRWASVVLQEVSADVFGILILADVWAAALKVSPADVVTYYLAECLRYTNRGLGHFPDSDGMFLQLSYYVQFGALSLESGPAAPRLAGDPETVLAALRSLARVLADTALAGIAEPAVALYRAFGPPTPAPLQSLVEELSRFPGRSIEYLQEHIHAPAGSAA